jgi:hypothetical protein
VGLRTRILRPEKAAGVRQPPCLEDYLAALNALRDGAAQVRVGAEVITRADWLAGVAEGRRRIAAHLRERTGSADRTPEVEARAWLLEGGASR